MLDFFSEISTSSSSELSSLRSPTICLNLVRNNRSFSLFESSTSSNEVVSAIDCLSEFSIVDSTTSILVIEVEKSLYILLGRDLDSDSLDSLSEFIHA